MQGILNNIDEINSMINSLKKAERALEVARELSNTINYAQQQALSLKKVLNDLPTLNDNRPISSQ